MQKSSNPPASGSNQQADRDKIAAANAAASSCAAQRHVDHSPEPHAFRPVLLAGFGSSTDTNAPNNADFSAADDSQYSANISTTSFRSWENAARRVHPTSTGVFTSTFDTKVFPHEFFRSTAESLYAQLDASAFGLSRGGGNGNLQTCLSPSFESPFDSLVGSHTSASNAFCPLPGNEHYGTFSSASHHGATSSNHFISPTSMLNLPSTSQVQYGGATYGGVFGGFGGQQAVRGGTNWQPGSSGSNASVLDLGAPASQSADSSSHDHNMNATTYEMLCAANGEARASVMDQLGGQLHVNVGLPVTTGADGNAYLVSIVHDPTANSSLGGLDNSKVIAQLTSNAQSLAELDYDPRDLEQFAERFKQRRIKLGITQSDVGKMLGQLKIPGVGPLSQSTICRFESLTLSHNNMVALKPVLQSWLEYAEMQALEKFKNSNDALNGCAQAGQNDRKRKRTSITDSEKRALEAYFAVQPRPSSEKIAQIADKLNLKKNVVRVWFCNQRQKQKRMKFANQAAGASDTAANSPPAADGNSKS